MQELQSERIMESFRNMLPAMVTTLRDGIAQEIPAEELVPGDVIILHEGDKVPADGRLLEASLFKVDLASLTGESEPQLLDPEKSHDERAGKPEHGVLRHARSRRRGACGGLRKPGCRPRSAASSN